eukprot:ANDGO_02526.mRNA.1 Dynein-1-beta heavy chain
MSSPSKISQEEFKAMRASKLKSSIRQPLNGSAPLPPIGGFGSESPRALGASPTATSLQSPNARGFFSMSDSSPSASGLHDAGVAGGNVHPVSPRIQKTVPSAASFALGSPSSHAQNGSGQSAILKSLAIGQQRKAEPKVMIPFVSGPGQVPRKVEIERRRRLYASVDLEKVLEERGINYAMPPAQKSYLPLEAFDNTDFDVRNPEEWVEVEQPARILQWNEDTQTGAWKDCIVFAYDPKQMMYIARIEGDYVAFRVPRINCYFKTEDPARFADRVAFAHHARAQAEAVLRYNLYIDNMPTDDIPPMPERQIASVLRLSFNTQRLVAAQPRLNIQELVDESSVEYCRAMNRIVFEESIHDPAQQDLFASLQLPEKEAQPPVPDYGLLPIPPHDFVDHFKSFSFSTYLVPEVIKALQAVRSECLRIAHERLYQIEFTKTLRIDEYEQLQSAVANQCLTYLRENWIHILKTGVKQAMRPIGKGWLNLAEQSRETYEMSKLKRLMNTMKFMMEEALRDLVRSNVERYVQFVEHQFGYDIQVIGAGEMVCTPKNMDYVPIRPLFAVDLVESEGEFKVSTDPQRFVEVPVQVFLKGVAVLKDVPRLEQHVMDQFFWPSLDTLEFPQPDEAHIVAGKERISKAIDSVVFALTQYINAFEQYRELAKMKPVEYVAAYEEQDHTIDEMQTEVRKHLARKAEILQKIQSTVVVGPFLMDLKTIRLQLSRKCDELVKLVLELIAKHARTRVKQVSTEYSDMLQKLQKRPKNIEEVVEIEEYKKTVPSLIEKMQPSLGAIRVDLEILEKFLFPVSEEDFKGIWQSLAIPSKVEKVIENCEEIIAESRDQFAQALQKDQETLSKEVERLSRTVSTFNKHTDLAKVHEVAAEVKHLIKEVKRCEEQAKLANSREGLFGRGVTEYDSISAINKEFDPYAQMWVSASDWTKWYHDWMHDPFESLNSEEIDRNVNNAWRVMFKSMKAFKEQPKILAIAEEIKKQLDDFKPFLPLIQSLRQPGMRQRHWDALSAKLGFRIQPGEGGTIATLKDVFDMRLHERTAEISEICDVAGKEYNIERALDKMEDEWKPVEFEVLPYKETGTYVIRGSDEIGQMLDDHIVMTQSMSFSAFKKPFEERIAIWETKLRLCSDILEEWLTCQRNWLYLEPIFSSDDIMRQLPMEGKRFATVDRLWKKIMAGVFKIPHVMTYCTGTAKLLDNFQESNKLLDLVQKGLNDYLETKRQAFARFYFLSNDELLEILSQTREPRAVQKHLRKCFEAVAKLEFQPDDGMTHMYSGEGEVIPFAEKIYPKGNVEEWLNVVERMMCESIRVQIDGSLKDYVTTPRQKWVLNWAGQVVLVGSQVFWTTECGKAIEEKGLEGVKEYGQVCQKQLLDLAEVVRGDLPVLSRITLGALITIDVHARDVVATMAEAGISQITDFEWISQMRYEWDGRDLWVKQVESVFKYGYEYLGNTSRLVITPLTDRIYLTLTSALSMFLGGAPAGPAGTGKTETVKDLAKALAKQCVVFNCQEGLDYLAMGKFFKGLAMAGAWACFDEFNRIDVEVLSVVAQQMITLTQALRQGVDKIVFEGTEIRVNPAFAVFITMNPGYAGRTELPDNLKALFRPVACMVPDYALIAEIRLFSFGFREAKKLAQKMVATFRLSSEQLSSQDHYDFGMRAVNTVINAAGLLKRDEPNALEDLVLLRALRDSNLPKFLADDIVLFNGIISDLFPGVELPQSDYGALLSALKESIKELGLQPVDTFITKCIQLFETTVLRHGLMLVGPTGSGKTCARKVLARAQGKIHHLAKFDEIMTRICNPKSITMGQLYGQFDEATHEWTDGILATLYRECAYDASEKRKWLLFDGPVDALWIESMNTVLDENKKLCLVSGEIIPMSRKMNIIFEVEDLSVASPATVSRCGMVYMEPATSVGNAALVSSWLDALPETVVELRPRFQELFDQYLYESLKFVRRNCREYVPTVDNNLVCSFFRMIDCFMFALRPRPLEDYKPAKDVLDLFPSKIEPIFVFSLIWSIGGALDRTSRPKFDQFLRELLRKQKSGVSIPKTGLVYDYYLDLGEAISAGGEEEDAGKASIGRGPIQWKSWIETVPPVQLDPKLKFSDIIVPTMDSIRYSWLLEHLLSKGKHVLCVGPTGTGKTLTIADKLMRGMSDKFIPQFMAFSAQTSANQTQDIIDGKLDKRRKGIYGPPSGKQYLLFVDDVNMPAREEYGAQPPIELLRQFLDHGGWYDRAKFEFRNIVDTTIVGAMGPPGGGRNPVTNRFLRHFNFVSFPEMEDDSMRRIFSTILSTFLKANNFADAVNGLADVLIEASIAVYNIVLAELLPTPVKSHYTFNLRDLAKVVQGLMSADPKKMAEPADLARLWTHECSRVFRDRLVDNQDRMWFDKLVGEEVKKKFKLDFNRDIMNVPSFGRIVFADFMNMDTRSFEQVTDAAKLQRVVEEFLDDYNNSSVGMNKPMKLVMFMDALEHVCRISRILRQPGGNALLLGVGGSGRQSLARVASFIMEYQVFQIEISKGYGKVEWRNDLRKVLMKAGVENKPCVFLFSDTQIVKESFLEDINNLLNSGEVPNIMEPADMDNIYSVLQPVCQAEGIMPTKINMFARFVKRCKENGHIILAFSPIGEAFRTRLRMFPALVNCCTIDWFSEWPDQALRSVAQTAFEDTPLGDESMVKSVVDMCVSVHQSVERASGRFLASERRYNYVTPTSYLQLLSTFKRMLALKREEVATAKKRLVVGLDKLESTEKDVAILKTELTEMQPVLIETSRQVEEMMIQISKDKADADETRKVVLKEEADSSAKASECKAIKEDAQRDLDEALPALESAVSSLKSLKVSDIQEVAAYKTPPAGVKLVMEAICILKNLQPKMVGEAGKKVADYWEPSVKLLKDARGLLDSFFEYDKDNIAESVIKKIGPYIESPDFVPDKIRKVSTACTSMCQWCHAMYKYHFVSKSVEPKRQALAAAEKELGETMERLKQAKATLKTVEEKIADLELKFSEAVAKKDELGRKVRECEVKMDRAGRLIGGLGGEKIRWRNTVEVLGQQEKAVIGDVIVASGAIAYVGAFTAFFRQELYKEWIAALQKAKIVCTSDVKLTSVLGDPVKIREWTIKGLPTDGLSIENGIILSKSTRWPLLIDPQGQANKWVKNTEKENGLEVLKLTDEQMLRSLENAVRFGKPVLIENVGESLPASLEPILLRETFKQGGSEMIKLGDSVIPYHPDFRLYITTKLRNPHYSPETCVKVTLLNFLITPDGLQDQLLGIVVAKERPDLEEMKNQLVVSNARMKKELKTIEDEILRMLSESSGDILEDEALINTLAKSKETSVEINAKVAEAEETEKAIDTTRGGYRPVAVRAAILFFCVADMAAVDPMYQYSLQWFVRLFISAIDNAEKGSLTAEEEPQYKDDDAGREGLILQRRLKFLNDYFTYSLYLNICRSLFEKHKLLFSFLLTTRILQGADLIDGEEWRFLLTGGVSTEVAVPNPAPSWLMPNVWAELNDLSGLPRFQGFASDVFAKNIGHFEKYFESANAHRFPLPGDWETKFDQLQKMLVLRCLRPDKVTEAVQDYVAAQLGGKFIEPPPFDLPGSYADSSPTVPLIFVLSAGADPASELFRFADEKGFTKKLNSISLGQGQGPIAERLMADAMERGGWILLQNCHLATSWMPSLERIVENFAPEKMHRDFRLWLTSMPSEKFPVSVLQNSVKMTNEPPKGLRANLRGSFVPLDQNFLDDCKKPDAFRKLLFALCFFHAQIQERRKFGPLGWNIRYEFTNGDLLVCMKQLKMFLDKYEEVPFKVLRFLFGQINYGGRVTDDWDRRLLLTMQNSAISQAILVPGHSFSDSGIYHTLKGPEHGEPDTLLEDYLEYIKGLPINPAPEVFGLHENADITCAQAETRDMMELILSLQPRTSGGAGSKSREAVIEAVATDILNRVPDAWHVGDVMEKYPTTYAESMNTVLVQEVIRYNKLLVAMRRSLQDILKALKGLVVMSGELEAMGTSLFNNQVPKLWSSKAYPSLKLLSSWTSDLLQRLDFINSWIQTGMPTVYWISGLYFPQAALTGILQNYARKYKVAVDSVSFDFVVMPAYQVSEISGKPEDGAYMRGLYMEGARWDPVDKCIGDSKPRELFAPMPILWFKPVQNRVKPPAGTVYECPVYKTVSRAGTLSTTGHSTNFVLSVEFPTRVDPSVWIKRGCAAFCALAT